MSLPFKYGPANIYLTPVWVELPSDPEVAFLIKPLSHSTISQAQELEYFKKNNNQFFKYETLQSSLADVIIDTRNTFQFPNTTLLLEQLTNSDLKFLYERLIDISIISNDQLDNLEDMLTIQFNPQFQGESWDCSICQAKKLDYSRGCGFLDKDKRDPSPMLPRVNGRRATICPISELDGYVLHQASLAHSMLDAGVLPEPGGIGNQTVWFVRAALLYKRKLAEAESAAMKAATNK